MLTHDRRILIMALAAGLPGVVVAIALLWSGDFTPKVQWTLSVLIIGVWFGFTFGLRDRVVYPLQTIANLLAALREDDFSIRARVDADDALGDVMQEVNALSETLRSQRLGAQEATALLRAVMAEIDVAIFAFDKDQRLVLVNRYGERPAASTDAHRGVRHSGHQLSRRRRAMGNAAHQVLAGRPAPRVAGVDRCQPAAP
jgi:nitrogen fixation/metabolism regulation signal transduction histidine kinase